MIFSYYPFLLSHSISIFLSISPRLVCTECRGFLLLMEPVKFKHQQPQSLSCLRWTWTLVSGIQLFFYRNRSRIIIHNSFACFFLSQSFLLNFSFYFFIFILTTIDAKVDDVEIVINMDEVEMKTARSSGAGRYSIEQLFIQLYVMIRLYLQTGTYI